MANHTHPFLDWRALTRRRPAAVLPAARRMQEWEKKREVWKLAILSGRGVTNLGIIGTYSKGMNRRV